MTQTSTRSTLVKMFAPATMLALGFATGYRVGSGPASGEGLIQTISHDTITLRDTVIVSPVVRSTRRSAGPALSIPLVGSGDAHSGLAVGDLAVDSLGRAMGEDGFAVLSQTGDSVTLIPTVKVYCDSTYRAVVSGVNPSLDSLEIYPLGHTVTKTVVVARGQRESSDGIDGKRLGHTRWGFGVTAGVAATPRGVAPAVAVGLTYRLF